MSWTRRDFLKFSAALSTGALAGPLLACSPSTVSRGSIPESLAALRERRLDYRKARAVPTICFGCTTHCGVIGWVQDDRVRLVEGNPLDPNSQGTICSKANGMISYTDYPERILYPMRRVGPRGGGRWKRISWDQALDEIADRMRPLREAGTPERFVFHYGRDKTKGFSKRFTDAFGTPNRLNRRSICSSNRRAPLMSFYGREFEWESQDLERTKYVLNFGGNPMEAYQGGLFMRKRLIDAKVDRGARIVTFEVRPSATASVSTEYHAVAPASDGAIALAMARTIVDEGLADRAFWERWANWDFDEMRAHLEPFTSAFAEAESGVAATDIERIAREFARSAPACCTMSNRGSAKHYNGVQADRAIRMLDVLVGNVGRPGGFCLSSLRMWKNRYGQEGLPVIDQPAPRPHAPKPWKPGTREFETLPRDVQERVRAFPEEWQERYFGELATPSEYPLSWHWYAMRVGQLVHPYIQQRRQEVDVYMSYTLGAAYGFPEARLAREVLTDEALIPFHVAIDVSYGEQAALADIILPDATSLERWDAHSTNSYGLRPYTGIRQPLVEPLGEARPAQIIWRDLARRIGGGMERYFDFDDLEDYYRAWYAELPIDWETFKARGIWMDEDRPLDYELHEREVPAAEVARAEIDPESQTLFVQKDGKRHTIGIVRDGRPVRGFPTPSRKIEVRDETFPLAARLTGLPASDINASAVPTYARVPEHVDLSDDEYVLTTFKWNVHTQGRSAYWKHAAEIVHTNPVMMAPVTAERLGVATGDEVELTTYRPKGASDRSGERDPVGRLRNRVRVVPGMHPRVVACAHHSGHWEHGVVARGGEPTIASARVGMNADTSELDALAREIWWSKDRGGVGHGVAINDVYPINPAPLVGGQNWFDNVCRIRRVSGQKDPRTRA
ncbi:MAG TPA: twin-arginine translocation signal domain-containing protein [Deltaproteobacteria bacterium]|nr:twin-arginine translocation signal domain-containing protein [Deltaproteobacteria bacterium]